MACCTPSETAWRIVRSDGTGSIECRAINAIGVGPLNGGAPPSISYATQARL